MQREGGTLGCLRLNVVRANIHDDGLVLQHDRIVESNITDNCISAVTADLWDRHKIIPKQGVGELANDQLTYTRSS